jgi:hypothetical protein
MPLWGVFFSPAIFLTKDFELYRRSEGLFFLLILPLDIHAMCTLISLNILETTLAVPYRIELRSRYTAVCGASYFPCHMLSPFYLSVDGLTLFHNNQPINCYEGILIRLSLFFTFFAEDLQQKPLSWSVFKKSGNNNDGTN